MNANIAKKDVCYPLDVACPQLATAYVPKQPWCDVFEPEMGLEAGTIFPCLAEKDMNKKCNKE